MTSASTSSDGTSSRQSPGALPAAFRLDGRTAVVTGAASGIGAASAVMLGAAGTHVWCADRDTAGAEAVAAQIVEAGGSATARALDVSDRSAVFGLADEAAAGGRLDIWCNIAGVIDQVPVADMTDEQFDRVFDINFRGAFWGVQAALGSMIPARSGSIINMCSGAIDTPAPTIGAYAVSKAALNQLTKTTAVEVGQYGVRVNAVAPGFITTAMTARHYTAADGTVDEQKRQAAVEPRRLQSPLGQVGEPDDIAYAVLYLATDAARFVTGQVIRPNGGVAMPW